MPIAGYTTTVQVTTTLEKITKMLAKAGARRIQTEYSAQGEPSGVIFSIETQWGPRDIALPINTEGVLKTLARDKVEKRYQNQAQANRIAWRIAHDWLRAQLAIIDAGMVTMTEVMFPYLVLGYDDQAQRPITTYQKYTENQRSITA